MKKLLLIALMLVLPSLTYPAGFFATLTVFPDPGKPGTTSVDGDIGTNGMSTYAAARSTADCTDCSGSTLGTTENSCTKLASPCNQLSCSVIRFLLNFDTSALGAGATITAATLSVTPSLIARDDHADFVRVVTNGGASNNDYSTSDYGTFGTTAQSNDVNVSSMSAGTYVDFTLNATGLSNINKTGITKFALRCGMDINNTAPTPADSDCATNSADGTIVFYNSADTSGTGSDPKLVITYTPATGGRKRTVEIPGGR